MTSVCVWDDNDAEAGAQSAAVHLCLRRFPSDYVTYDL